jgi:Ribosomal protein S16
MGGVGARIRLARFGKRNAPFYNIVVIDGRCVGLVFFSGA